MSKKRTSIGLNAADSKVLVQHLNALLCSYQIFYQNTRGFHWNIKGEKFFELHLKFEELYTDLQLKIDEIAERILTLGDTPIHSFAAYMKGSAVKAVENVTDGKDAVKHVLAALSTIIGLQREILRVSGACDDEGTNAMMSDYIRMQEKLVWMYTAFMG